MLHIVLRYAPCLSRQAILHTLRMTLASRGQSDMRGQSDIKDSLAAMHAVGEGRFLWVGALRQASNVYLTRWAGTKKTAYA